MGPLPHVPCRRRASPSSVRACTTAALVVASALLSAGQGRAEPGTTFKVIVNPSTGAESLTRRQLSDIFLKKMDHWPAGDPVMPVDQSERALVRFAFTRDVHRRSLGEVKTYWQQKVFAGGGMPPLVRASDAEVMDYVKYTPGAVGYISVETRLESGVRLLQVTE